MEIQIFGKENCPKCRSTKRKVDHLLGEWQMKDKVPVTYYDLETPDGMAEGAFRDVLQIPTVIVQNESKEIARWSGIVPPEEGIRKAVSP